MTKEYFPFGMAADGSGGPVRSSDRRFAKAPVLRGHLIVAGRWLLGDGRELTALLATAGRRSKQYPSRTVALDCSVDTVRIVMHLSKHVSGSLAAMLNASLACPVVEQTAEV